MGSTFICSIKNNLPLFFQQVSLWNSLSSNQCWNRNERNLPYVPQIIVWLRVYLTILVECQLMQRQLH